MPFSRPTLTQLIQQTAADIAAAIPGADALLRFSNLGIIGKVLDGLAYMHYGYQDWIAKNAVPFTSTAEYLEGWAGLKSVTRKPAKAASGSVLFTNCQPGVEIAGAVPAVRADGVSYTVSLGAVVDGGGNATIMITADVAGANGNCDPGVAITLGVAIAGIQSTGFVTGSGGLSGGADAESDDELRTRMLQAYQSPPQGGSVGDYPNWALAVPGVTRAWAQPNGLGAGSVIVYFMMDDAEAAHGGFPQGSNGGATAETREAPATGDQLIVANAIYPLQPVTALVSANAPTNSVNNFVIAGLTTAPGSVKTAINAAIDDVFIRKGSPGGVYLPDGGVGGSVALSDIESAIAAVAGSEGFVITTPPGNITSAVGALPTRGTVTYS